MANEKLHPNTYDSGWTTGSITDIDEAIADADGNVITSTTKGEIAICALTDSVIVDGDTVTAVDITVRARSTGIGNDRVGINMRIGGVIQGSLQTTVNLTSSFVSYTLSDVNWDVDWTAAQMDGMDIRIIAGQQGKLETAAHEVDCIDVDIVYTLAGSGVSIPIAMYHYMHNTGSRL